jgi:hypothetical protein
MFAFGLSTTYWGAVLRHVHVNYWRPISLSNLPQPESEWGSERQCRHHQKHRRGDHRPCESPTGLCSHASFMVHWWCTRVRSKDTFSPRPLSLILAFIRPMIGGSLSRPADRFPDTFGNSGFLRNYPYFLACAVPASFSVLAWIVTYLFLREVGVDAILFDKDPQFKFGYLDCSFSGNAPQSPDERTAAFVCRRTRTR